MLESLIKIIKACGGNSHIHKNDQVEIDFTRLVSDFAVKTIYSSLFFGVVQLDTSFSERYIKKNSI